MATVDEWNKAQQNGVNLADRQRQQQEAYTKSLQESQTDWANQYYNAYQQGNRNPQELSRYLGYTSVLPDAKNIGLVYGSGANITEAQKDFYHKYSEQIRQGTNNLSQLDQYKEYANVLFGGQMATLDKSYMKHLSLAALNGDHGAINYLNAMGYKPLSGTELWDGMTDDTIKGLTGKALDQYRLDNPFSQSSKDHDNFIYNQYSEIIRNGGQLDDNQQQIYQNIIDKWNLDDFRNPYVRQQWQLEQDRKNSINAQDVALNQALAQMDANSFQQMQQLQEMMAARGMSDSGIAADQYMRAQMANNQLYQQAFSDASTNKANINATFNDAISKSRITKQAIDDQLALARRQQEIDLKKIQSDQDQWMTETTGQLYINGQVVTDSSGNPITTVEWKKMAEEQRHNIVTEFLTGQKNAWDYEIGKEGNAIDAQNNAWQYQLGLERNAINREKIAADLQTKLKQIELDWATLDYNYAKLEADNQYNMDRLAIMKAELSNEADKAKLDAWAKQANSLVSQITAYQKNGEKPPKHLVDKYNEVNKNISNLIGGASYVDIDSSSSSSGSGSVKNYYAGFKKTSDFGYRTDPFTGKQAYHNGIDIAMAAGTPIKSTVSGYVVYAEFGKSGSGYGGYGNTVVVQDSQGNLHQFSHMSSISVKKGQQVTAGMTLGGAGNTGRSKGNHLHYTVKNPKGQAIDGSPWILK